MTNSNAKAARKATYYHSPPSYIMSIELVQALIRRGVKPERIGLLCSLQGLGLSQAEISELVCK